MEIKGGHQNEDGRMCCTNCGCISFTFKSHLDADTYYVTQYRCDKCGSTIEVIAERGEGSDTKNISDSV